MNRIQKSLVLLLCTMSGLLYKTDVVAQTVVDSLKKVLAQPTLTPEEQVLTRLKLSRALSSTDRKSALTNAQVALSMSRSLKDSKYAAQSHSSLVSVMYGQEDIKGVGLQLDSAFLLAEQSGDPLTLENVWYRKGWMESRVGKPHEAVKSFQQALKYGEKQPPNSFTTSIYYNLSAIYADWDDLENQSRYAFACLAAAKQFPDPDDICNAYQAVATSYEHRFGKDNNARQLLDSSLYYNRLAIQFYQQNKDRISFSSALGVIALNTANLYAEFFPRNFRDSAQHYLRIAQEIGIATHQQEVIASSYGMQSSFELMDGHYDAAAGLLLTGLHILQESPAPDNNLMAHFMSNLSEVAEKKGDLVSALNFEREHSKYFAAAFDAEKMAIAKRLEAQYQTQQREQQVLTLQEKAAFNKKLNIVYIILIIASVLALIFLFRSYHFHLKSTIQQQTLLEKEKQDAVLQMRLKEEEAKTLELERQEAALQAQLQTEAAARLLAEQQLIQAQKEQLQKDLLAGTLQVEQKNELLQTLQAKLQEKSGDRNLIGQINRMIDQDRRMDEDFENAKTELENIHPEFFSRLQLKANNGLTRLDLKHCSYISMGLSTKEISSRLGVAPKSILMSRYRIKQKLGLGKEEGLDAYLMKEAGH
ncbi:hypothetical protein CLV59_11258 [Chitinophaga dinghuensis]|uniref:HTH luxR-type domain-containing protein n=1 Tax=Chitinophaga dinghuensis TaxID=1539050 RepID=A0A327VK76_9BACT|nr:hypothetical protein [Chitinophaga dinghuensis]RAJ73717.1 hypothetical protein CLV59_11258 [Chitinophaga dinghuensis]